MNSEKMFNIIGLVDDDLVEEAEDIVFSKKKSHKPFIIPRKIVVSFVIFIIAAGLVGIFKSFTYTKKGDSSKSCTESAQTEDKKSLNEQYDKSCGEATKEGNIDKSEVVINGKAYTMVPVYSGELIKLYNLPDTITEDMVGKEVINNTTEDKAMQGKIYEYTKVKDHEVLLYKLENGEWDYLLLTSKYFK